MIREIRTCDICDEQIKDGGYYKVKIRSGLFVNYCNYDMFGADKRTVDVCETCASLFIQFVKDTKAGTSLDAGLDEIEHRDLIKSMFGDLKVPKSMQKEGEKHG